MEISMVWLCCHSICFHLWCELTLALRCHSIGVFFHEKKMKRHDKFQGIYVHTVWVYTQSVTPHTQGPWTIFMYYVSWQNLKWTIEDLVCLNYCDILLTFLGDFWSVVCPPNIFQKGVFQLLGVPCIYVVYTHHDPYPRAIYVHTCLQLVTSHNIVRALWKSLFFV